MVSYYRGTLAPLGVTMLLFVFGIVLTIQLFTALWMIGIFGVIMLLTALCFTGIEFNTEDKLYRVYYRLLFFKFGKWQSYEDFKFISLQGVTLSSSASLQYIPVNMGTHYEQTAKIILLNQTHTKKLFVLYSKKPQKTKATVEDLITQLNLPFAKYSPPMSQARLKRMNKKN
jgi:hypothetical protein